MFLEAEKLAQSAIWKQDVTFRKGERIQVVAPSGSGKTSLIHFLYGLRKDYNGAISFDDRKMARLSAEDFAATRSNEVSIIFQDLRLFPDHSARENIVVKQQLQPYSGAEKLEEMAAMLGVSTRLGQQASTCSYGEQQRIAIIRALQQPFDFLLMDEPFSHLDEDNRHKAMQLIDLEAGKRGAAIIFADLKPIEYFRADRVLHL